jgi:N-acetylmuramoyl-L-alanine amidase
MKTAVSIFLVLLLSVFSAEAKTKHHGRKLKSKKAVPAVNKTTRNTVFSAVVLDAGHGGHDAGGIPQNLLREKDVALDVVLRLNRALQKAGFKTILTRRDDTFIPLGTRVAIANAHPEAVFVSVHYDASPRRGACGISTHFASPGEAPLAASIQRRLITTTDGTNRGIKNARFCVLRNTKVRAVLVECGFLTNPHDAALAQRASYRQKQAEQICAGIVEYRNSRDD